MAFILEQAGGQAVHGKGRILDVKPEKIHQRSPIFLGSKNDVDELQSYLDRYDR